MGPVCFEKNTISVDRTERRYELLIELFGWLGCNQQQILYGIDGVREALNVIECI
jgi:hypothetical protein